MTGFKTASKEETHTWVWHTRWFQAEEKEEIRIGIDHEGRLGSFLHLLPENQAGASLSLEEAQRIAEAFVVTHLDRHVTDANIYKLLESQSQKREKRLDHRFVWERVDKKVEEGEFRVEVQVVGDEIGRARTRYKAPEAFLRKLNEQGMKTVAMTIMSVLLVIVTIVMGTIYLLRAYRNDEVNWRFGIGVGIVTMAWFGLDRINGMVGFYKGYNTSQALMTFWGLKGIGILIGMTFLGFAAALIVVLADALFRQDLAEEMSFKGWLDVLCLKAGSATLWGQALVVALCYEVFDQGMHALAAYVK